MIDPAMMQWNPNPEMFPNQPVGLPIKTQRQPNRPISSPGAPSYTPFMPTVFNTTGPGQPIPDVQPTASTGLVGNTGMMPNDPRLAPSPMSQPRITDGQYSARIAIDPPSAFDPPPGLVGHTGMMPNDPRLSGGNSPFTAQIASDPPSAFNPPPAAQTGSNWQVPTPEMQPFSRATPEPQRTFAPSFGPMQDLALQMGQYGAPSGYRAPSQMGVTPYNPGGGSGGGYDGADVDRPNTDTIPPIISPGGGIPSPGMGGGGLPTNTGWINNILDNNALSRPGLQVDLSNPFAGGNLTDALSAGARGLLTTGNPLVAIGTGLYNLWNSARNSQTPEGPYTPDPSPNNIENVFGYSPEPSEPGSAPSGPQTTPYTGHSLRRPIPIVRRTRPGHLGDHTDR